MQVVELEKYDVLLQVIQCNIVNSYFLSIMGTKFGWKKSRLNTYYVFSKLDFTRFFSWIKPNIAKNRIQEIKLLECCHSLQKIVTNLIQCCIKKLQLSNYFWELNFIPRFIVFFLFLISHIVSFVLSNISNWTKQTITK